MWHNGKVSTCQTKLTALTVAFDSQFSRKFHEKDAKNQNAST